MLQAGRKRRNAQRPLRVALVPTGQLAPFPKNGVIPEAEWGETKVAHGDEAQGDSGRLGTGSTFTSLVTFL